MKVFLDDFNVRFAPEGVDNRIFGSTTMSAGSNETQNVARATCRPGIGRQRTCKLAIYFHGPQHVDCEISAWLSFQRNVRCLHDSRSLGCWSQSNELFS